MTEQQELYAIARNAHQRYGKRTLRAALRKVDAWRTDGVYPAALNITIRTHCIDFFGVPLR